MDLPVMRMDLRVSYGRVVLPDADPRTQAEVLARLRMGTFPGTVAGQRVIGIAGIAALTGMLPASLHMARSRRNRRGGLRRPRDLPDPLYRVEYRGAVAYLFALDAVREWAVQTGKLKPPP